ncbi:MAG: haloacid dehalogenase-like hydrolase [Pirellulales bacterium]|nr:haloacid dehalogenase-like hydrolase [Pirellulales bacterium]
MYIVLFDIDGTLLQSGGAGSAAFFETFRQEFGVTDIPGKILFAGRSDRAIAEEIMRACQIEVTAEAWQRFSVGYCRRLPQWLHACEGGILPGVSTLLNTLQQLDHVSLGLLTGNMERGAKMKLAHYGIVDRFAFGGYGHLRTDRNDIAADAKQAAVHYVSAQGVMTLRGVMVIGDTPNDVLCARSIDAFAVAVATGGSTREELSAAGPDLLLDDLTNMGALLAEIRAADA